MRLIDADALKPISASFDGKIIFIVTLNEIRNAPTVDAALVRHGRWIERKEIFSEAEGEVDAIGCSICGKSQRVFARTKYCPNCGADMRK